MKQAINELLHVIAFNWHAWRVGVAIARGRMFAFRQCPDWFVNEMSAHIIPREQDDAKADNTKINDDWHTAFVLAARDEQRLRRLQRESKDWKIVRDD